MALRVARSRDLPAIQSLLTEYDLTFEGVADHLADFVVVDSDDEIVAVAGLEIYDGCALLRSVAVRSDRRRHGQGRSLVDHILAHAVRRGVSTAYLLTTTAAAFFARLGFESVPRSEAPAAIRATREFSELCPQSAEFMRRDLTLHGDDQGETGCP